MSSFANEECVLVNRAPTNSLNWLNIETLARARSRDAAFAAKGVTPNWLQVGQYPSSGRPAALCSRCRSRRTRGGRDDEQVRYQHELGLWRYSEGLEARSSR